MDTNTTEKKIAAEQGAQEGAKKAPAKRAPAKRTPSARKAPAKAPAKKATAPKGKATPKQAPKGGKVRWTITAVHGNVGKNQDGVGLNGTKYQIAKTPKGEYAAKVTPAKGKAAVLVEAGTFSQAYWACVNHNKAAVAKSTAAADKKAAAKSEAAA